MTHLVNKFPVFYGTKTLITGFTRVRHRSVACTRYIQSHPTSSKFHFILSPHFRLGWPSDPSPSRFPTNNLYVFFISPVCIICLAQLILFDLYSSLTVRKLLTHTKQEVNSERFNLYTFSDRRRNDDKWFRSEWENLSALNFFVNVILIFYWN